MTKVGDGNCTDHNKHVTAEFSYPLRVVQVIMGLYSGKHDRKFLSLASTLYHLFTCCLGSTVVIAGIAVAVGPDDNEYVVVAFQVLSIHWYISQVVNNCIMFINCHRKQNFTKFYEELNSLRDELTTLGVTFEDSKERRNQIIILIGAILGSLANMALRVQDLFGSQAMDPLFGWTWNNRNISYELYIGVKVVGMTGGMLMLGQWMYYYACYLSVCYYLWSMLSAFNNDFAKQVDNSPESTIPLVERYRNVHLKLCALVRFADALFHVMLANNMLNFITTELILLNLLANSETRPSTALEIVTFGFWMSMQAFLTLITIICAQKIYDKTGDVYDSLLNLSEPNMILTSAQSHQIMLFISKAKNPDSFTIIGLLEVNNDLGVTLVSVLITYYLVVAQMNS